MRFSGTCDDDGTLTFWGGLNCRPERLAYSAYTTWEWIDAEYSEYVNRLDAASFGMDGMKPGEIRELEIAAKTERKVDTHAKA